MGKINYKAIRWNAETYGEFCGSAANLVEIHDRVCKHPGFIGVSLANFVYWKADPVFAYAKGDIVKTTGSSGRFATVTGRITEDDFRRYLEIQFSDGSVTTVGSNKVWASLMPADIPDVLIALARAEAGKTPDLSKCPLKRQGACMEA